ncbi:MAG: flagellar assembly protein FliW [Bacteroidetes bacterium]|nr:flagellar assembly protein FliW [Bacteroidota bacterium]
MPNKITEPIKINSYSFGEIEIQPDNIFYFENGLLGFESLNNFVLISDDEIAPFKWLMAIEDPGIMLPIVSPFFIDEEYHIGKYLDLERYVLFSVVTFNDGNGNVTANLRAPIILCSDDLTGEQIIIVSDAYSVNHIISSKK